MAGKTKNSVIGDARTWNIHIGKENYSK